MKKYFIKFSDERNKKYSIETKIVVLDGKKYVLKCPLYDEGKEHMDSILHYADILAEAYPEIAICPVKKMYDGVCFDYIEGELLIDRYKECLEKNSKADYLNCVRTHIIYIVGKNDNLTNFVETDMSRRCFGDMKSWLGKPALKVANFDATASNIVLKDNRVTFIDYEWVFEEPVPKDLVIYHCVRDAYFHISELEQFYPLKELFKDLGMDCNVEELENLYRKFFQYVISEENGNSFAEKKNSCLKEVTQFRDIQEAYKYSREEWTKSADNWKAACEANERLEAELSNARTEWKKCADNWKAACEANEQLEAELSNARTEWKKCADNWKASCEAYNRLDDKLKEESHEHMKCVEYWKLCSEENRKFRLELKNQELEKKMQIESMERQLQTYKEAYEDYKNKFEAITQSKKWRIMERMQRLLHIGK